MKAAVIQSYSNSYYKSYVCYYISYLKFEKYNLDEDKKIRLQIENVDFKQHIGIAIFIVDISKCGDFFQMF